MADRIFQRLGEVARVRSGFAFKSSDMTNVGVPIIKIKNITPPFVDTADCEKVPEAVVTDLPDSDRYLLQEGDILIAMTGATTGKVGRFPKIETRYYLNQRVGKVYLIHPDRAEYRYLYFVLSQPAFVQRMFGLADGSAQGNISGSQIENLKIPLPPLREQRAIACILGALDDKIELNRRMNETLEGIARAIFKSWFVEPTKDRIPDDWHQGTLGDVALNPRRNIRAEEIDSSTPYLGLEHMPRRSISLSDWGIAQQLESNKFEFKRGDILFGKLRPYFHKVGIAPVDGVCSTDILVLTPQNPDWFGFVLGHVMSDAFVKYTTAHSSGTKMPRTTWQDMSSYKVALPPAPVAASFTNLVRPLVDRIVAGIHMSRTLAALRDALLPKLISGELRVPDAERIIGMAM